MVVFKKAPGATPRVLEERREIAARIQRPSICDDCQCNPTHPSFNPLLIGGHIPPHGNPQDCDLWVVGISGGDEEEARGMPLVGPSGRKARHGLEWAQSQVRLEWDEAWAPRPTRPLRIYWTNLLNCRSIKIGAQGKIVNRTPPSMVELRDCMSRWFLPLLQATRAKGVFLLGTDVYKTLKLNTLFDVFGKSMGHRMLIPQKNINPKGLGNEYSSYGTLHKGNKK